MGPTTIETILTILVQGIVCDSRLYLAGSSKSSLDCIFLDASSPAVPNQSQGAGNGMNIINADVDLTWIIIPSPSMQVMLQMLL